MHPLSPTSVHRFSLSIFVHGLLQPKRRLVAEKGLGFTRRKNAPAPIAGGGLGVFAVAAAVGLMAATQAGAALINGGFESPRLTPGIADFTLVLETAVPGWDTTASDDRMEFWSDSFQGVTSYEGAQHVELNANQVSTLFQDVNDIPAGSTVAFQFAHRGRQGTDTLRLSLVDFGPDNVLGGGNDTTLFTKTYSTGNTSWAFYTSAGEAPIIGLGNVTRFAYESVSSTGGATIGNFLDAVSFGANAALTSAPEPSTALVAMGLLGVAMGGRWRRARA